MIYKHNNPEQKLYSIYDITIMNKFSWDQVHRTIEKNHIEPDHTLGHIKFYTPKKLVQIIRLCKRGTYESLYNRYRQ